MIEGGGERPPCRSNQTSCFGLMSARSQFLVLRAGRLLFSNRRGLNGSMERRLGGCAWPARSNRSSIQATTPSPQHTEQKVVWRPPQRGGDLPFLYHPALTDPTPRHTLDTDSDHGEPTAGVHAQEHPHHGRRGLHVRAPGWRMRADQGGKGASTMIITARSIDLDDGPLEPPDWGRAAGTD